jgi:hypothetical protein
MTPSGVRTGFSRVIRMPAGDCRVRRGRRRRLQTRLRHADGADAGSPTSMRNAAPAVVSLTRTLAPGHATGMRVARRRASRLWIGREVGPGATRSAQDGPVGVDLRLG